MKKIVLLAVIVMLVTGGIAIADTGKGVYSTPNEYLTDYLNSQDCITHKHDLDKEDSKFQKAVGLDLVVYENDVVEVVQTNTHNLDTSVSVFGAKVQVNVWKMFAKKK